jgi:hypothetical protein
VGNVAGGMVVETAIMVDMAAVADTDMDTDDAHFTR